MKKYVCTICGYVYDDNEEKIKFEDLPEDWSCPLCGAPKSAFEEMKDEKEKEKASEAKKTTVSDSATKKDAHLKQLNDKQLSAMFSNLAKGCEKQYLAKEALLYTQLADYYKAKCALNREADFSSLLQNIKDEMDSEMAFADKVAQEENDRGAMRVLLWNRKVTTILKGLLERYEKEGDTILDNTNIYVCEICGFVYIGDEPPEICPVCKVPRFKLTQIRREA